MNTIERKKILTYALMLALALSCTDVIAASNTVTEISAKEMMVRSEIRYKGDDMVSVLTMTLTNKHGKERRRDLLWYHKEKFGLSKDMQKFYYPSNIKNVSTLYKEVADKEDLQFLYLPAAKKLRRVSSKNNSWVGSDFIYEDLQDIKIENWQFRYIGNAVVEGFNTKIIEMVATKESDSSYSMRHNYIRVDGSYYPGKVKFFDKSGKLLKELLRQDVRTYKNALYANHISVHNVQDNHRTQLKRLWIDVNTNMPASYMNSRQMQKPIEKYKHPQAMLKLVQSLTGESQ